MSRAIYLVWFEGETDPDTHLIIDTDENHELYIAKHYPKLAKAIRMGDAYICETYEYCEDMME